MSSAAGGDGETVRASHILIKHQGSRRKASWKDPDGRIISATTRADAAARLLDLRNQILSGQANFADLAARHSDCSSARRGGDLGTYDLSRSRSVFFSLLSCAAEIDLVGTVDTSCCAV
jgi:NIMA-interacting peptidyl-prolyl cis-trans isomerase 1